MRCQIFVLLNILFISCTSITKAQEEFVLVEKGVSKCVININKSSSKQVREAAEIFKEYLKKSTGATIEIGTGVTNRNTIHIGNASTVQRNEFKLDEDGYIIQKVGQSISILGGSNSGTEYGVYAFLEKYLGIKWLMPTERWTIIPKNSNVIIKEANFIENPKFLSRRLAPVNINGTSQQDVWGRRNRLRHRVEFNHNVYKLFPVIKDKSLHPLVYPVYNNKRYFPTSITDQNWQPNFSSKQSVEVASLRIRDYFKANADKDSYSLAINDSKRFSQSKETFKMNYLGDEDRSNQYFKWVNDVVQDVNRAFPNKRYGVLAYDNTFNPPDFQLERNVVPFITYERLKWIVPQLKTEGYEISRQWNKVSSTVGWYDYDYGFNYYLPRLWVHHMQSYLKWASENNVKYYVAEFYPNWGEGPKGWATAKLLWNPNQNVDSLLNVWYKSAVGENASGKIREYYSIWEQFWTVDVLKSKWWNNKGIYLPFNNFEYLNDVPESYIVRSDKLLDEAYNLAETKVQKDRVSDLRKMWTFYKSALALYKNNKTVQTFDSQLNNKDGNGVESNYKTFHNLMEDFKTDPLFGNSVEYWSRPGNTHASMWNTSSFSGKISEKSTILSSIKNPSFEDGKSNWGFWISSESKGSFDVSESSAQNGKSSLKVSNVSFGSVYQDFMYDPGSYLVMINYFVPQKKDTNGKLDIDLQVFDSNKKSVKNLTSTSNADIPITPGSWKKISVSFKIKVLEKEKPKTIRFKINIKDLANSIIYFDNLAIQKISE